ncbi:MAG: hypothetical protein H6765_08515 [Candidatus Peribacteria bacterium]|nr:MAG: hypothetical protein H6765_08515 [Candidatus Peribacteria bacterium]
MPESAELVIQYSNVFDKQEDFWKKFFKKLAKILGILSGKGRLRPKADAKEEGKEDEAKKIVKDVSFSISMHMQHATESVRVATFKDITNVYDKFLREGGI